MLTADANGNAVMGGIGEGLFGPTGTYTRQQAHITFRLYRAT